MDFIETPVISTAQQITIIIPCFNESKRLDVKQLTALFSDTAGISLCCVNDGSLDGTGQMLTEWAALHAERVNILHLPRNMGKAEAVRHGMLAALASGAQITGYIDADMATPVSEVKRLIDTLATGPGDRVMVMGSRVRLLGWKIERNALRHYLGRLFATAASLVLRVPVYDTQCGAKFFRNTSILKLALAYPFHSRWIFDVELIGRLAAAYKTKQEDPSERFLEVPLRAWQAKSGSKLTPYSFVVSAWDLIWFWLFEKPLTRIP